jgi:phosphoesterase RecJ-like protein
VKTIGIGDIARRLPAEERILIAAHENPDGDALGSVASLSLMAAELGIPYIAYFPGEGPFPPEYGFIHGLQTVRRGAFPAVDASTTAYILDCASPDRLDPDGLRCAGTCINVDHHQDNTGFGTLNLIEPAAPSTTEVLYRIFRAGGFHISQETGTALYVGLVTDTGRFQYANTTPAAHRMAADLQELGVDVNAVYREVYESVPLAKMKLLERALGRLQLKLDGRLAVSWLESADFEELGAEESHAEGIIDRLRTIEGVKVAALIRGRQRNGRPEYKGSLRSTDPDVNVASLAHMKGGGGHILAAGFSAEGETLAQLLDWLESETSARL